MRVVRRHRVFILFCQTRENPTQSEEAVDLIYTRQVEGPLADDLQAKVRGTLAQGKAS